MGTDSENDIDAAEENESSKGWPILYLFVVAALAGQIVLYAWLTKTFE